MLVNPGIRTKTTKGQDRRPLSSLQYAHDIRILVMEKVTQVLFMFRGFVLLPFCFNASRRLPAAGTKNNGLIYKSNETRRDLRSLSLTVHIVALIVII